MNDDQVKELIAALAPKKEEGSKTKIATVGMLCAIGAWLFSNGVLTTPGDKMNMIRETLDARLMPIEQKLDDMNSRMLTELMTEKDIDNLVDNRIKPIEEDIKTIQIEQRRRMRYIQQLEARDYKNGRSLPPIDDL